MANSWIIRAAFCPRLTNLETNAQADETHVGSRHTGKRTDLEITPSLSELSITAEPTSNLKTLGTNGTQQDPIESFFVSTRGSWLKWQQ